MERVFPLFKSLKNLIFIILVAIINSGCNEHSGIVTKEAPAPDISDLSMSENMRNDCFLTEGHG